MKDSSKLLNFNINRKLGFSEFRGVDFQSRRDLLFDLDRRLSFDSQRALPFGKKGVKFRHFICGACGRVVEGGVRRCPHCKVYFSSEPKEILSTSDVDLSEDIRHSRMKEYFGEEYGEAKKPASGQRKTVYRCGSCGNDLRYVASQRKWYCNRCKIYIGTSSRSSPRKIQRPPQRAGTGPTGVRYVPGQNRQARYPDEVVIFEEIGKKRKR